MQVQELMGLEYLLVKKKAEVKGAKFYPVNSGKEWSPAFETKR